MTRLDMINATESVLVEREQLIPIAEAALLVARLLMETGASAKTVHEECSRVVRGLGAQHVDLRSGYDSLEITIAKGASYITRIVEIGPLGVNYRLAHAVRALAKRIAEGEFTTAEAISELTRVQKGTARHPRWVVAVGVGFACAAFGRLLGMDWAAFIPVLAGGTVGQWVRQILQRHGVNVFAVAGGIAFLASGLGALGSRFAGSTTVPLAMVASVLLLVPGVPALDAQYDILEGHPTLGIARAVVVSMTVIFMATGVLIAGVLLGVLK
ncbi:MAG TPA: threonine/serine exporter family protein [Phycisphaerae bacterium]|nr:threonine/serine exporter family protein [Phycisphaerae bacterium]